MRISPVSYLLMRAEILSSVVSMSKTSPTEQARAFHTHNPKNHKEQTALISQTSVATPAPQEQYHHLILTNEISRILDIFLHYLDIISQNSLWDISFLVTRQSPACCRIFTAVFSLSQDITLLFAPLLLSLKSHVNTQDSIMHLAVTTKKQNAGRNQLSKQAASYPLATFLAPP